MGMKVDINKLDNTGIIWLPLPMSYPPTTETQLWLTHAGEAGAILFDTQ